MSHSQFLCSKSMNLDMHGLIFETSIWLLAGSTRYLSLSVCLRARKNANNADANDTVSCQKPHTSTLARPQTRLSTLWLFDWARCIALPCPALPYTAFACMHACMRIHRANTTAQSIYQASLKAQPQELCWQGGAFQKPIQINQRQSRESLLSKVFALLWHWRNEKVQGPRQQLVKTGSTPCLLFPVSSHQTAHTHTHTHTRH